MHNKPVYHYSFYGKEKISILAIFDLYDSNNPTMSVTNGIEIVLEEIKKSLYPSLKPDRIIYRDTDGIWDEVVATDWKFVRFSPIGEGNLEEALKKISH